MRPSRRSSLRARSSTRADHQTRAASSQPQAGYGGSLSEEELQRLAARIEKHPHAYAAQAMIERSSTPVWKQGSLQPRHVALRTFVAADGEKYDVMPGGLIRVTAESHVPAGVDVVGQGSKDLWILSEGPVAQVSLLKPSAHRSELSAAAATTCPAA